MFQCNAICSGNCKAGLAENGSDVLSPLDYIDLTIQKIYPHWPTVLAIAAGVHRNCIAKSVLHGAVALNGTLPGEWAPTEVRGVSMQQKERNKLFLVDGKGICIGLNPLLVSSFSEQWPSLSRHN
ncbi:hypothetical protein APSETT445_005957 [Aspergillus pseudonomiae]